MKNWVYSGKSPFWPLKCPSTQNRRFSLFLLNSSNSANHVFVSLAAYNVCTNGAALHTLFAILSPFWVIFNIWYRPTRVCKGEALQPYGCNFFTPAATHRGEYFGETRRSISVYAKVADAPKLWRRSATTDTLFAFIYGLTPVTFCEGG